MGSDRGFDRLRVRKNVILLMPSETLLREGPRSSYANAFPAGRAGFEPAVEIYGPDNRLAGGPIRPLWHLPNIPLSSQRKERDSNPR